MKNEGYELPGSQKFYDDFVNEITRFNKSTIRSLLKKIETVKNFSCSFAVGEETEKGDMVVRFGDGSTMYFRFDSMVREMFNELDRRHLKEEDRNEQLTKAANSLRYYADRIESLVNQAK